MLIGLAGVPGDGKATNVLWLRMRKKEDSNLKYNTQGAMSLKKKENLMLLVSSQWLMVTNEEKLTLEMKIMVSYLRADIANRHTHVLPIDINIYEIDNKSNQ